MEDGRVSLSVRRGAVLLVSLAFVVAGFLQLGWATAICWKSIHAADWPTVPATVIESHVRTDEARGGAAHTPTVK